MLLNNNVISDLVTLPVYISWIAPDIEMSKNFNEFAAIIVLLLKWQIIKGLY